MAPVWLGNTLIAGTSGNLAPRITLQISPSPALVQEDGEESLIYTFTRTGDTSQPAVVNYTVGGTAINGTDYETIASPVVFLTGSSTATVVVTPIDNSEVQPDRTVAIAIAAGEGYVIGTTVPVVGTILNDDSPVDTVDIEFPAARLWLPFDVDEDDISANEFEGTLIGTATISAGAAVFGAAGLALGAEGGAVEFADDPLLRLGTADFTIAAMVTATADQPAPYPEWLGKGFYEDDAGTFQAGLDRDLGVYYVAGGNPNVGINYGTVEYGVPHRHVFVREDGVLTVYLDGEEVASGAFAVNIANAGRTLRVGRSHSGFALRGSVDDFVMVAGTALTLEQAEYLTDHAYALTGEVEGSGDPPVEQEPPPEVEPLTIMGWNLTSADIGLAGAGIDVEDLTLYTGPYDVPNGTVLDQYLFRGPIRIHAGDIIVSRSLFEPLGGVGVPLIETTNRDTWTAPSISSTVQDCEFSGQSTATQQQRAFMGAWFGAGTVRRNWVHHMGGGLACYNTGTVVPILIESNVVSDVQGFGDPMTDGNHSSCLTFRDHSVAVNPDRMAIVRGNFFEDLSPNASGAMTIYGSSGRVDNVLLQDNYFGGNTWNVIIAADNPNPIADLQFINNRHLPNPGSSFGAFSDSGSSRLTLVDSNLLNRAAAEERGTPIWGNWNTRTVTMAATTATTSKTGGALVFTFTRRGLTQPDAGAVTVLYTVSGTGVPGTDFTAPSGSLTIPGGVLSGTVSVSPLNNAGNTTSRTVILNMSTGAGYVRGTFSATGTITA